MDQSGSMKTAFTTLDGQISGLTGHSMCPAVVGKVYGMVRGYMISQVDSMRSQAEGREELPQGLWIVSRASCRAAPSVSSFELVSLHSFFNNKQIDFYGFLCTTLLLLFFQ